MDNAALIYYLQRQIRLVDYVYVCAGAVYLYDYILTLHLEVKLVWFSRWTYTKVLFLVVRYMTFVNVWLGFWNIVFLGRSLEACRTTSPVHIRLLVLGIILSEVILAIRTWAVWHRNRYVGIGLGGLTIANVVVQCVMLEKYIPSFEYAPPPFPGWRGCFVTGADGVMWVNFTAMAVVEAAILILMAISAYWSYKWGNSDELSHIVYRDGIQLYIYLLLISVGNVAIMKALPFEDTVTLSFIQEIMYPVLTTRIVLNIRDAAGTRRGFQTELHDTYAEALEFASASCQYGDDAEYTAGGGHDVAWVQPPLVRWHQASDSVNEGK